MNGKLKKAVRLHQSGRLREARDLYQRVLKTDPENITALHFYGLLNYNLGEVERGRKLIRKALHIDPNYISALQNLGRIHLECGEPGAAEELFRKIIGLDAANAEAINSLSIALRAQEKLQESEEAALLSCRLEPERKESWYNLGKVQQARGNYSAAIESYIEATELDPSFSLAQSALCRVIYALELKLGTNESALPATAEAYRRWLKADPDNPICQFMLSACSRDSGVSKAPESFVVRMFDEFSSDFDQNLADLNYQVPRLISEEVARVFKTPSRALSVLDAGCGTGLLASSLAPWSSRLTGVDLSAGMLSHARRLNIYDELVETEICRFLGEKPNSYDLIVCADTLIYFGDLKDVLGLMQDALTTTGKAVISFEHNPHDALDYCLEGHGRYSHSRSYIERIAELTGLIIQAVKHETLRKEAGNDVGGLIVTLSKTRDF